MRSSSKQKERQSRFCTSSQIPIERLYTSEHAEPDPGQYPYTRGIHQGMYRSRFWTMRQYAGFGSAIETNKRFKYLLEQGQTGLSVAFDLPTQIGYDSDDAYSLGEVGKVGVAIDSLQDMELLLEGIPLDKVSTSMTINAPASILLAMYLIVAKKQGLSFDAVSGTVQNDILKEYVARGTYIYPPKASLRLTTDLISYCTENVPNWNPISISGYHIREAGSTAVQEIAFTLANGIAYVEEVLSSGLDIDRFAPRLSFFFNAHNNFFEEIAKFRAARRMWAKLMRERFHAQNPKSWQLRFHTQTGGSTLAAQQPDNNIVRVTLQALAAVLGGTQSLHTNAKDEALSLPTQESARLALRTQQVIAYESGVADVVDPLGGSYFVEQLTSQIEDEANKYLERIHEMGGALRAVELGFMQSEIRQAALFTQRKIESEQEIIIGVNKFQDENDAEIDHQLSSQDNTFVDEQLKRLQTVRETRDAQSAQSALSKIRQVAASNENLMPAILEAVEAYATVGEIAYAMRDIFGEY